MKMELSPAKELEDAARKYAAEAIRLDSQGARGMAIQMYQRSISTLVKLAHLYPDNGFNRTYFARANAYRSRIKSLQSTFRSNGALPSVEGWNGGEATGGDGNGGEGKSGGMVESLKASYEDLVILDKPGVTWNDVVGLEDAKRALSESIIFPVQRPDLYPLGWPRGLLMYGPPGCGKTMLAAATAAGVDAIFLSIDAASIMSRWLGEGEKNVAKLFAQARKSLENGSMVIMFIDELDSLLGSRTQELGGEVRVRNQFLKEMDGIHDKGKNLHLYVIGASNKPWSLDFPFLRRFQRRIYVPLPDFRARVQMFTTYTQPLHLDPDVNVEELATMTEGYSGSDILDICQAVQIRVVSELFDSGAATNPESQPRSISINDFRFVLKSRRPSVPQGMLDAYVNWTENFKAL